MKTDLSPEELCEYVLKGLKKQGADDAIVSSQSRQSLMIKFSNNKVNTTKTLELTSIGVYMVMNKSVVATNIIDLSKKAADESMKKLVQFAKNSQPNNDYNGIAEGKFKYPKLEDVYDKKVEALGDKGVDYVEGAINLALETGAKRASGVLESSYYNNLLLTSNGIRASEKDTKLYFSIRCFTDKDASGHMVSASRTLSGFDWKSPVMKAAEISKRSKNPQPMESGKYDVIFDHLPYANILATVGSAASIFSVESGLSFLTESMDKPVANKIFTFYDDPTLPNGFSTTAFDAEGVPTKKKAIIDKGILKTYLHNNSTAKRHKTQTTGNAGLISPSPFNLVLDPGDMTTDEMISSTKKGIYITNVWYTRFQNYNTGDFSTIPRDGAFLIENGKITHPVKDIRVSDNVVNIMKNTERLGKESRQIVGWEVDIPTVTPMALVKNINISRSEK
jgi:PmbA protein